MSPLAHFLFFIVLTALGGFICRISVPMVREHAGYGYRLVSIIFCLAGLGMVIAAAVFLVEAVAGIAP